MIRDEDLVQVRSADELRVGMTVVIKGCLEHKKPNCSGMILKKLASLGMHDPFQVGGLEMCPASAAFLSSHSTRPSCWCRTIPEGRLFRLKDLDAADELRREKLADRPLTRVLERVR